MLIFQFYTYIWIHPMRINRLLCIFIMLHITVPPGLVCMRGRPMYWSMHVSIRLSHTLNVFSTHNWRDCAGMVTNGTVQISVLITVYLLDVALLIILRPFSNSFIQWVETFLVSLPRLQWKVPCFGGTRALFLEFCNPLLWFTSLISGGTCFNVDFSTRRKPLKQ